MYKINLNELNWKSKKRGQKLLNALTNLAVFIRIRVDCYWVDYKLNNFQYQLVVLEKVERLFVAVVLGQKNNGK